MSVDAIINDYVAAVSNVQRKNFNIKLECNDLIMSYANQTSDKLLSCLNAAPNNLQLIADTMSAVDKIKAHARLASVEVLKMQQVSQAYSDLKKLSGNLNDTDFYGPLSIIIIFLNELFDTLRLAKDQNKKKLLEQLKKTKSQALMIQQESEENLKHSLNESFIENLSLFQQFWLQREQQAVHRKIRLDICYQCLKKTLKQKLSPSSNSWKDYLLSMTKNLSFLNRAPYEAVLHSEVPIQKYSRFASCFFNANTAAFSGTTYAGSEKSTNLESNTSSDAIAFTNDSFSITDGCGYYDDLEKYNSVKRVASSISKNLVRLGSQFSNPDFFKHQLKDIFKAQYSIALGKVASPLYMEYATGCLVKCFKQSDKKVRVITASIGDGIVIAINFNSLHPIILSEAWQFGTQPKSINDDSNQNFDDFLQISDNTLDESYQLIALTDGAMSIFTANTTYSSSDKITHIAPTLESIKSVFGELVRLYPNPTPKQINDYILECVVKTAENARQAICKESAGYLRLKISNFCNHDTTNSSKDFGNITSDAPDLKDASISDFLSWSEKNGNNLKLILNFLRSTEFSSSSYNQKYSLRQLWDVTHRPHTGDDASLIVFSLNDFIEKVTIPSTENNCRI